MSSVHTAIACPVAAAVLARSTHGPETWSWALTGVERPDDEDFSGTATPGPTATRSIRSRCRGRAGPGGPVSNRSRHSSAGRAAHDGTAAPRPERPNAILARTITLADGRHLKSLHDARLLTRAPAAPDPALLNSGIANHEIRTVASRRGIRCRRPSTEQNDEWAVTRRYMSLELSRKSATITPSTWQIDAGMISSGRCRRFDLFFRPPPRRSGGKNGTHFVNSAS